MVIEISREINHRLFGTWHSPGPDFSKPLHFHFAVWALRPCKVRGPLSIHLLCLCSHICSIWNFPPLRAFEPLWQCAQFLLVPWNLACVFSFGKTRWPSLVKLTTCIFMPHSTSPEYQGGTGTRGKGLSYPVDCELSEEKVWVLAPSNTTWPGCLAWQGVWLHFTTTPASTIGIMTHALS